MKQITTHIAKLRGQYAYNRAQIIWLTGMTDEELSALQFDTGLDWLHHYTLEDRLLLVELMKESIIWAWWMNEWNRLDDQFILRQLYGDSPGTRLAQYRSYHQVCFLENTPAFGLLEEGYAKAIGQFNKQITKP